jgi:molecular chaperone DnaK
MKKTIGIDLGTTNSVIAFKTKNTEIIRNSENEELTRSCVGLINEERVVGKPAFSILLKKKPENLVLSIKRLMGGNVNDPMVTKMIEETKSVFGYYKFGITELKGGVDGAVAVVLEGKQYTPEQISSEILGKLKRDFEAKEGDVTHAVITVPAYFTEKQKNATRIAANLAGFKVSRLLAEPTAAAIAYGVDNIKAGESKTVLVYDFGGGTFDLSILTIADGQYLEMGSSGDRWLGGDDIDKLLQDYVYKKLEKGYNIKDIHKLIEKLILKKRNNFLAAIREKTEDAKIQLSSTLSGNINIISLLEDENGDDIDIDITITRNEFEDLIRPLVLRTVNLVDNLLKTVHYDIGMINHILLVGGSSCIPLVKEILSEKYGSSKILMTKKPMLAIAEGAAILAHRLQDEYECPSCGKVVQQNDKQCQYCNYDLESEFKHSGISEIVHTTKHKYFVEILNDFDEIIDRQVPLPTSVAKPYKTTVNNQQIINLNIYNDIENEGKELVSVGYVTLDGLMPKDSEVIVEFEISLNETMICFVYPKGQIAKKKKVVLGRGNDAAGISLIKISNFLEKVEGDEFDIEQKEYFFKAAQKRIKDAEILDPENSEHRNEFFKIDYEIGNEFDNLHQLKKVKTQKDEKEDILHQASLMCDHYASLLGTSETARIKRLIYELQEQEDIIVSNNALESLKELVNKNMFILDIFLLKIASSKASKTNSSDANLLLKKHDEIVTYLVNGDFENGFNELNEAWTIAGKYFEDNSEEKFGRFLKK